MDNTTRDEHAQSDIHPAATGECAHGMDATGIVFSAVVLFAALAAGMIVYRTANSDPVAASHQAIASRPAIASN